MGIEEENLFATAESDDRNSARELRSRTRLEGRLRDRSKKRARLVKMGQTSLDPWLTTESLDALREQLREHHTWHHRNSRSDKAVQNSKRMIEPIALSKLQPGAIVDAWIPFADSTDYKRRPAVVVRADRWDVEVFPLTSSLGHRRLKVPMHVLDHWKDAGLSRKTGMQQRRVSIPRSDILGVSGELVLSDRSQFYMWVNSGTQVAAAVREIAHAIQLPAA